MADEAEVVRLLTELHGEPVRELEPLSGGFWSSAFGYRVGDDALVLRLGNERDWFEVDRAAMAYASDDLPVPDVLDIGEALGGVYAISRRAPGRRFLEDVTVDEVDRARPLLSRLLGALRAVPPAAGGESWREWLLNGLDAGHLAGWRTKLAAHPDAQAVFDRAAARVRELVPDMPERRDLVHGDLLHGNVLVTDDASRVTGIFSWKCSTRGDHLFDTAWCTFWGEVLHPGIAAAVRDIELSDDERRRHRCYELHIAATHLGWNAWVDDRPALEQVMVALSRR